MRLFNRSAPEVRETSSYTDVLVELILSRAAGDTAKATATAAVETVAGIVARSFAAAEVEGPAVIADALSPTCLAMIGRSLIRRGEIVLAMIADGTEITLAPSANHDVRGGHDPASWMYRVNLAGPTRWTTRVVPADEVIHVRYAADPVAPWRGVGPIESAKLAGTLSAELAQALGHEASGPRGHLLPIPVDGQDPTVEQLRQDIGSLKGRTALVEAQDTGFDDGSTRNVARGGWDTHRLGMDTPVAIVELHQRATAEVLMACGISPGLFAESGTVAREAWRQLLHGVIAPLGDMVADEISTKVGRPVRLTWAELRASDIQGRARALQSMTGAGATLESAADHAGLSGLQTAPEPDAAPQPTPDSEGIG